MKDHDQHDATFKGVMEQVLALYGITAIAGVEVSKFPIYVDVLTERNKPVPPEAGVLARLLNSLPRIVVFEFKGPTDPLKENHIWQTLAYATLVARERKLKLSDGVGAVIVFVACQKGLRGVIVRMTEQAEHGWRRCSSLLSENGQGGLHLHFVEVAALELVPENLPFLIFRDDEQGLVQVVEMILSDPTYKGLYGKLAYKIQRKKIRDILTKKGLEMTELLTVEDMIEDFGGLERVIEEVGLKRVIEEVGLKRVIEEVGLKRVIEEVGLDRVIEEIGPNRVVEELMALAESDEAKREEIEKTLQAALEKIRHDKGE
ncbi:MAG: hypothetical protein ACTSUH_06835 [Candidatus Thorarchaeota archaeon]